jgi:hypothetical protein
MKLVRFEWELNNIRNGLFTVPMIWKQLNMSETNKYFKLSDRLCPKRKINKDENLKFYFTEKGFSEFFELIVITEKALSKHIKLIPIEIDINENDKRISYCDDWQVALKII